MTYADKLQQLAWMDKGVLQTSQAKAAGVPGTALARFVRLNGYERISRGIYLAPEAWKDEAYLLQLRCPQAVFSHESALLYHDLTDREPLRFTVTARTGYNPTHLTSAGVKVHTVRKELYGLGTTSVETVFGHQIKVYDMERSICDIVRNRYRLDSQILYDALKMYARRPDKNLHNLTAYARLFHVEKLVFEYMGVLL